MAIITIQVTVPGGGWADTDTIELLVGSEDAADPAASTPTGGRVVDRRKVGQAQPADVILLTHTHAASDKCATLPVGVTLTDAAGNTSAITETTVQLADPPQGVARPDISSDGSGEITLTWLASPDV